jgi:putative hemolysin
LRPRRQRRLQVLSLVVAPLALPMALSAATVAEVAVLIGLLVLSGVFSGSEVAMFSISAGDRQRLAEDGSRAAKRVLDLLSRPKRLLITILLMNNVANVGAAILATVLTMRAARAMGLDATPYGEAALFAVQVVLLTFLLLVLSEITPKLIATRRNVQFAKAVSGPILLLSRLFRPLTGTLASGMELLQRTVRTPNHVMSNEDLKTLADMGEREGTLQEEEAALIHSIVEFGDTTVRAVMVSRLDTHALPATATLDEAFELIRTSGHSRFPVYREHLDNVLGILYAKDLIPYLRRNGNATDNIDWGQIVRPARFVPLGRKLDDMLTDFQASGTHIAVVVDEYGGTAGIVTLEDILEEIVGDIRDEHDRPEPLPYEKIGDNVFTIDAGIDLDDLNDLFDLELDTGAFDFETLGGLIFHLVGDIPEEGTVTSYDRMNLRVEELDSNRIKRVRMEILPPPADDDEEEVEQEDREA